MKKATSVTDREVELKNTFLTAYDVKEKAIAYLKRVCHKSVTHPFLFFAFSQIRNL